VASQHDTSGNQVQDAAGRNFGYDLENRQTSFNGGSVTYAYDGDGRRVKKTEAGGTTIFVYDAFGRLAAEYSDLAPTEPSGACFLTADHLGSTRVITDAAGAVRKRYDYLPFGEEIGSSVGGRSSVTGYSAVDATRQRFSGKERDAESGLDYFGARYFSGAQGRFTTPDPLLNSGRPWLPQSWNRYAYTLNNPLRYIDPTGLYEWAADCKKGDSKCEAQRQWFRDALAKMRQALEKSDPKSQEYRDLLRVSKLYGDENKRTGIKVAFVWAMGSAYSTQDTATFDVKALTDAANAWSKATAGAINPTVEFAAEVAHEGSNVFDRIGRTNREDYPRILRDEINAYRTQSDVNYLFNTRSIYGLWDPSWAAVDRVTLRNKAIEDWAKRSTDATFGIKRK